MAVGQKKQAGKRGRIEMAINKIENYPKIIVYSKRCNKELIVNLSQKSNVPSSVEALIGWCNSSWSKHGGWKTPTKW